MRLGRLVLLVYGLVVVGVVSAAKQVVMAQSGLGACVNSASGEIKVSGPGGCKPGWVNVTLSTGSGGGGLRVRDAAGKDVGAFLHGGPPWSAGGVVIRHHAPYWLAILVGEDGFRSVDFSFYFESTDCSGPAYLRLEEADPLTRVGILWNGLLHVPGDSITVRTIRSSKDVFEDGGEEECWTPPGGSGTPLLTGPDTTVDPATFNLVAPFHLAE